MNDQFLGQPPCDLGRDAGVVALDEDDLAAAGSVAVLLLVGRDRSVEFLALFDVVAAREREDDADLDRRLLGQRDARRSDRSEREQGEETAKDATGH